MLRQRLVAIVTAGALMLPGCATGTPARLPASAEPPFARVAPGDAVVARLRDGGTARFVIDRIEGETVIATDGRRYQQSNLLSLRRNSSTGTGRKTVTIVAIAAGAAVAVVLLVGWWLSENTR
jgi:hypothetical protein